MRNNEIKMVAKAMVEDRKQIINIHDPNSMFKTKGFEYLNQKIDEFLTDPKKPKTNVRKKRTKNAKVIKTAIKNKHQRFASKEEEVNTNNTKSMKTVYLRYLKR